MFVVQVVEILWTKATRGAPRSNERAVIPRAFAISRRDGEYVVQRHRMTEWEGFRPMLVEANIKPSVPGSEGLLRTSRGQRETVILGLLGTPYTGQPKRPVLPKVVELLPGEYARITLNARHATHSGQYYSETIYNVASGEDIAIDRFLSEPDHDVDLKANLF
jgi:hypothetical protein